MKKLIVIGLVIITTLLVCAHEFWLQPQKFFYAAGDSVKISFMVGENFTGELWDLQKHKVEKLEHHHLDKTSDLRSKLNPTEKVSLKFPLEQQGTHLLVMQSNAAFIELEGDKFNEYLQEDGLEDVYAHREKTKTLDKPAKEFYTRYTKLMLQTGDKKDETFKKVVGFPIEIIPEKNPYTLKKGDIIRFKILWEGKPLFGAKVKVWNRANNRTTMQNIYTEKNGTMETRMSNSGPWMVSVVKMVPSKDASADWHSHWGSLVFGVE